MTLKNIFIAGMPKCGTTSLAEWMVRGGLAEYRVPGVKEPHLYANDDAHPSLPASALPLLDASQGYANPVVIGRLPEHDTHIVICLRNQFDRAWSHYKMYRLLGADNKSASDFFMSFPGKYENREFVDSELALNDVWALTKKYFARRSHAVVEKYFKKEVGHLMSHSFLERIQYELAFYLSRRTFPLFSVLGASLYYFPVRSLLEKYQPSDISVLSVNLLRDSDTRDRFVHGVFDKEQETPDIPVFFSSAEVEFEQPKPDFNDKAFDWLRAFFGYDLAQARPLIETTRFGSSLLDNKALDRYL